MFKEYRKSIHCKWLAPVIFLGLIIVSIAVGGCGEKGKISGSSAESSEVIVGLTPYEPYAFLDNEGNFGGIDVEIAREAFSRMGYTVRFKMISRERKDMLLANGQIDCFFSGFRMKGRENDYTWAGPYMYSRQVVAVPADSNIYTLQDLEGRYIAAMGNSLDEKLFSHEIKSDVPQVDRMVCFSNVKNLFAALRKGYVDAIAGNEAVVSMVVAEGKGEYRLLKESTYTSEVGAAFQKGSHSKMSEDLAAVLKEMNQDGTIAKILEGYGLDSSKAVYGREQNE